ncbi:MAG: hypothetical protein PHH84_02310 [Oscillospiraceae bacterium]|nr:hypothetical protein [Oscillospiraceae bacterium]MDD4413839.1 hypothetical protein [Oscillospiraceae bacterium]
MKHIKEIFKTLKQLLGLHKYSKDIIHGSIQFTVVLYVFAGVIYLIAPHTGNYLRSISYYRGALEVAPVVLAAGVISGLLCDLILRKIKPDEKQSDNEKKK